MSASHVEMAPMLVQADTRRNILRVHFRGHVQPKDMEAGMTSVHAVLARLAAGFVMVTDLTGLENMDIDCVRHLTRLMDACVAARLGRVIRIIPDPAKDIGFNLLSMVHYRGKIPTLTCENQADAENALAKK